ncbi:MAG: SpoVA/SpoVAEb family sporulation membrane protein [Clostridia bacterium]|nr:SpoVA/SpoVAEb family sporulation membrane protein [Clostridia bacterium]
MFDKKAKPSPRRQAVLDRYSALVDRLSPRSKMGQGLFRAFVVGGAICTLGQGFIELGLHCLDMTVAAASTFASVMIVLLTAALTGAGVFDKIGQYAGAGAFVPISGFANAMVSPAMEFTREGLVLGLGAKLFTIAGPVLVWGVSASVVYGVIYWLITILG